MTRNVFSYFFGFVDIAVSRFVDIDEERICAWTLEQAGKLWGELNRYDLAGIQSEKIDRYIEGMKNASASAVWKECTDWAMENLYRLPGVGVTILEATGELGGMVRHIIPAFRIPDRAIDNDVALVKAMGVKVKLNFRVELVEGRKQKKTCHENGKSFFILILD